MRPRAIKRRQRRLTAVLRAGHGGAHETKIPLTDRSDKLRQRKSRNAISVQLVAAEREAQNKKRKAEGKPPLESEAPPEAAVDEDANKRRKLLMEAIELDKDDSDDEKEEKDGMGMQKWRTEGAVCLCECVNPFLTRQYLSDKDKESEEEDDTAELLCELEKIKRERVEEKDWTWLSQSPEQPRLTLTALV